MSERCQWDPDELAASWVSPPGLGRCVAIGSAIGVTVAFVGIALPSLLSGMEWPSAVGFGVFVAFWGGLGFGSMMGGVAYVMRLERVEARDALSKADPSRAIARSPSPSVDAVGDRRVA